MIITELIKAMPEYSICKISEEHIGDVMGLMKSNEYFYSVTQKHDVCREDCIADLTAVPPGIDLSKKTYVALYEKNRCIAVLDFIEGFPEENIGYLGLFMLDKEVQGKGVGKDIFSKLFEVSTKKGFEIIELACYETNKKGLSFWSKMGFCEVRKSKRETDGEIYTLISMQKK